MMISYSAPEEKGTAASKDTAAVSQHTAVSKYTVLCGQPVGGNQGVGVAEVRFGHGGPAGLFLRAVAMLACEGSHDSRDNVERKIGGAVGSSKVPSTLASFGKIVHAQAKQATQQVRGTPVCGPA